MAKHLLAQGAMIGALAAAIFLPTERSFAISFDTLETGQITLAASGQANSNTATGAGILGGARFMQATSNGQISVSGVVSAPGRTFSHSQDALTTGTTFIRWDGNPDPTLQVSGLGGLDITKDGATGLKITVLASDSAFGQPITVSFILYDAIDTTPSGMLRRSRGSFTVNSGITQAQDFIIPFSSLVNEGLQGGADLTRIGAIEMIVNGNASTSHDMALTFVGTNGNCVHVPVNGLVVDQCGVCNGNNTTCADCLGVPNGPALPGVSCPSGNLGICAPGTWTGTPPRNCACQPDKTPVTEICDQLDNDCDGFVDEGFLKGSACTVGVGACSQTGTLICAPNGGAVCSVSAKQPGTEICDGIDNDCDGQVDEDSPTTGPLVDRCGVCKGNGNSCLDCAGTPNGKAKKDECGVCNGDNTSCVTCNSVDQSKTLGDLDSGAKEQQIIVRRAVSVLRTIPAARREARFISETLTQAQQLQILNWELSWTLPVIATTCQVTTTVCVTTSNLSILGEYRANNVRLRDLTTLVVERINTYQGGKPTRRERRLLAAAEKQFLANLKLSETVPEVQVACVLPGQKIGRV